MPTIAGQPITTGDVRLREQGDWFADVSTNSGERIPDGARVSLVIENVTLSGAIVRGDITGDVGQYQVAGRPEWGTTVRSAAYQFEPTVTLQTVLEDLLRETFGTNWPSVVAMPTQANLDRHFERPGTFGAVERTARDAIELLGLSWYVQNDGGTRFGVRPSGTVSTQQRILVSKRNDAIGYRVVNCEDIAAFAPGLTFEDEIISDVVYAIRSDDVEIHLWSRKASNAFSDAVRTAIRRCMPRIELQGLFSYTTVGPSVNGRHDLRSTRSRHLPDIRSADMWVSPGISAELQAGTRCLVAFADGDPTQPVLIATDATLPENVELNASTLVKLGGGSTSVVVDSASLQSFFTAVNSAIGVPIPTGYTSAKVKA